MAVILANLGSILLCIGLFALLSLVVIRLIRRRRAGCSGCCGSCSGCAMHGVCHQKPKE